MPGKFSAKAAIFVLSAAMETVMFTNRSNYWTVAGQRQLPNLWEQKIK
jgi:hypothetical protein